MIRPLPRLLVLAFLIALLPLAEAAATEPSPLRFKLSLGYHFSTGTYGSSDTTEIAYVPLIAKATYDDRWSLQLTVPYLRISGPAASIQGPSGPIQTTGGRADGLGDVLARGSYTLHPIESSYVPFIDLAWVFKFPTASRSAGLGTGELDFGPESELWWSVGKLVPFGSIGYRFLGSPPATALHDVVLASGGALYQISRSVDVGLLLDYRQAPAASIGRRLELVPFTSWKIDRHWSVDLYASAGLASGSPDAGVGLQLGYGW